MALSAILALSALFAPLVVSCVSYIPITVEEGGKVLSPCNASAVTGCRVEQPRNNTFMMTAFTDGLYRNVSASVYNATHCTCHLPPADAESPMDIYFIEGDRLAVPTRRLQYVALWTTALSRRPYLSTDGHGELVVSVHLAAENASVRMYVSKDGAQTELLAWSKVPVGAATTVSFSLALVPDVVQLLPVTVVLKYGKRGLHLRDVFLSRVAPPPREMATFVQVDYTRKVLLVNGKPLLGVGYYDSQTVSSSNFTKLAKAGVNWDMRYLVSNDPTSTDSRRSDAWIKAYLDGAASNGVYVMLDLFRDFESIAAHGNSTAVWANITREVMLFRNHLALLGYYICDDCVTQYLLAQESASTPSVDNLYLALKGLDPYHVVIGAEESGNAYTFTTANSRIPRPSLDMVMVENYVSSLDANARVGGVDSPGMDGSFRGWPLTWEPIVNSPGPWLVAQRSDLTDQQKALTMYSMSWLPAVLAKIPLQLHFRLFPEGQPIYDKILDQVGRYGKISAEVQDFLLAPPSGVREPRLSSGQVGNCLQCASIWRKPGEAFCALVVVINTVNATSQATFQLQGAGHMPGAQSAALQRVDGEGEAAFRQGWLEVTLAAFDTHVYVTECGADQVYI